MPRKDIPPRKKARIAKRKKVTDKKKRGRGWRGKDEFGRRVR